MRWNPFKNKSRPMARALVAALLIASTVATAPVLVSAQDGTVEAEAPVLVSAQDGAAEADTGDFSNDAANPTAVALANGSNLLSGSVVGGDSADLDYVTVNVPEGHVLAAADLVSYESGNGNAVSFIGIQEGTAFTEPADNPNPANLLGLLLFGVDAAGTDILPALGAGTNPFGGDDAIGFEAPLGAGDYTFWIQETSPNVTAYSIDLVVEPAAAAADAPAPADEAPAPVDDSTVSSGSTNVQLEFDGLEPLGEGFVYEGWVILDGAPVSTGRFDVEGDGSLTFLSDSLVADEDLARATTVVITIEPAVDPDPGPADPKPLAGDIVDGVAQLSIGHPAAIGDDFSEAGGSFFVATPTTESTDDEYSGVWFLVPPAGEGQPPTAGLDIPELPAGWVYEGWVVIDGQPVSTGRFLDPAAPDDFGGFSGPLGNPPFPGEDFIVNAPDGLTFPLDLRGNGTVVLTIEPADDDSPAPFAMRPLAAPVPAGLEVPGSVDLGPGPGVPSGVATLDIPAAPAPAPEADAPAPAPAPAPEADAPAPAPEDDAPAPAPEDDAPAPAPEDDAPAPAPEDDAPAPEDAAPAAVEFVNNTFGPRYLEVQPNVNVYSSNQSNTATEFILHPQGGGVFLIQSVTTGLYLHGHGEGGSYNVDVVGPVDDTAYWQLVEVDGGYHVVNVGLGQPLQAVRPGFNVITTAPADGLGDAVIWTIMPAS